MDEQLIADLAAEEKKLLDRQKAQDAEMIAADEAKRAAKEKTINTVSQFFGRTSSGAAAQALLRNDPAKYQAYRRMAIENGLIVDGKAQGPPRDPEADSSQYSFGNRPNPASEMLNDHFLNRKKVR